MRGGCGGEFHKWIICEVLNGSLGFYLRTLRTLRTPNAHKYAQICTNMHKYAQIVVEYDGFNKCMRLLSYMIK
jgi:hypothetical protein